VLGVRCQSSVVSGNSPDGSQGMLQIQPTKQSKYEICKSHRRQSVDGSSPTYKQDQAGLERSPDCRLGNSVESNVGVARRRTKVIQIILILRLNHTDHINPMPAAFGVVAPQTIPRFHCPTRTSSLARELVRPAGMRSLLCEQAD